MSACSFCDTGVDQRTIRATTRDGEITVLICRDCVVELANIFQQGDDLLRDIAKNGT